MKPIVLAYVSDWSFSGMPEEHAKQLTHANYSFLKIVDGRASAAHWQNEKLLLEWMEKNHDNLNVCVSIGGWQADGFSQAVASEDGREILAQSIIEIIKKYSFKGIDLDWEYPCDDVAGIAASPDDKSNFTLFIQCLRKKLTAIENENTHYLLTMAVGVSEKHADNIEFNKITDFLDYVYLMTYDISPWSGVTGHHTPLYEPQCNENKLCGKSSVQIFTNASVPVEKLVLGAAFYGRSYKAVHKKNNGLFQKHSGEAPQGISYGEISKRLQASGKRFFDDVVKAPYMYDESDALFATYDDIESLQWKAAFVKENNLAGIMFWEYNDEKTGELLNALHNGIAEVSECGTQK